MEAPQQAIEVDPIDAAFTAATEAKPVEEVQDTGPTAKQMALAEEQNALRTKLLAEQADAPPPAEPPPLIGLAAQGMDALHDALRAHSQQPTQEYIPPPRTARQMTVLEEELEAGRRAGERAREQQLAANEARAKAAAEERAKEGFTVPVYRPNDVVPNPTGGMGNFLREG